MPDYNLSLPDNNAAPDWILNPNGTSGTNNSFNANTFNWGSAISGAGQGLGALFTGIGALIHTDQPQPYQQNQPTQPNNTQGNNQPGGNNTPPAISTTTIILGIVLVILVIVVIVLAVKKSKP